MKLALLVLLPAIAVAAPPPAKPRTTTALLIPMDQGAEAQSLKFELWMQEALTQFPGARVKKTDELFGLPPNESAEASLLRAEKGFFESSRAFAEGPSESAERKVSATVNEYAQAAAAMKGCEKYCESLAMHATILQVQGQTDEAKRVLLDLLALNPTYEIDAKKYGREVVILKAQVATSRQAALRGNLKVKTRPSGARVFVDGQFHGFSPVTVQTLPIGRHLVQVERPGFKRFGQLVTVTADDVEVQAQLEATPAWLSWDGQMDKVAADVARGSGTALTGVGKSLSLDRALIGTVKEVGENGSTEVIVGLFDLKTGKKLNGKRVVFQGDEFGQLKNELARLVNALQNDAEAPREKATASKDPLDARSGLEEWSGEDRGGRAQQKTKKKGDPLDSVNGMEDW